MKLSVIIPNYNHGHFIIEQIDAIVNQTYKCHEIIIVDDKSTDNSVEIINKIIDKYPFIKLVQNKKNIGPLNIMNLGLEISSGDYVQFPSADDRMCSNLFEEAAKQFKHHPDAGVFCGLAYQMEKNGKFQNLIRSPLISSKSIHLTPEKVKKCFAKYGFWIVGQTMIFNKSSFKKLDIKFDPSLEHYSDIFIALIISLKFGACFTPKTLASWRYYSGYAEQHFSNQNLNSELFLKFETLCSSEKFNDLVPKSILDEMIIAKKYFYLNRRFFHDKKNSFLEFKLIKIIFKSLAYLYIYKLQLIKLFRIIWGKRRYKEQFIIKDDSLVRK
jgi:glycosyltransferase involved in cell wall biosynthesis